MKNFKLENNLIGDENWPIVASVFVMGKKEALPLNNEKSEEHNEAVIQSWENVVVLHAMSPKPTKFQIGFSNKDTIQYLKHEFVSDLKFAMRVGPDDFRIFALPKDLDDKLILEIVEYAMENDEKYKDIILI